jgi:hypothetical protein
MSAGAYGAPGASPAGAPGINPDLLPPPLRAAPDAADAWDSRRRDRVQAWWRSQDAALLARDRQIEENVRMLAGQQWGVWDPLTGQYIDISQWWGEEAAWRQKPTENRLLPWFTLTHARLTENSPILTFIPGPDRKDAELAEVMDVLWKVTWRAANMVDAHDRLMMWLIPAGRAYMTSRIDLTKGPWVPWIGAGADPAHGPRRAGDAAGRLAHPGPRARRPARARRLAAGGDERDDAPARAVRSAAHGAAGADRRRRRRADGSAAARGARSRGTRSGGTGAAPTSRPSRSTSAGAWRCSPTRAPTRCRPGCSTACSTAPASTAR